MGSREWRVLDCQWRMKIHKIRKLWLDARFMYLSIMNNALKCSFVFTTGEVRNVLLFNIE